jgi:hypothetical protein
VCNFVGDDSVCVGVGVFCCAVLCCVCCVWARLCVNCSAAWCRYRVVASVLSTLRVWYRTVTELFPFRGGTTSTTELVLPE